MTDYFGKECSLLHDKKLFLFDMDGTIYLDNDLFEGVPELLNQITENGGRYVFITNNSSKSVNDYVAKLHRLGLTQVDKDNFFTSAQASLALMQAKHKNDLIYLQGTKSFVQGFEGSGLNVTTEYDESAKVVLVGFDPEFTGEKIYNTCKLLTKREVSYYATNPDWVCPVEFGFIPDCGSMCFSIEKATGKAPVFIGKPQPEMIYAVMEKFGVAKEDTVVIGDRLYTDIASGNNAGVSTICVLSGEVTLEEVEKSTGIQKPDFVLESVSKLLNNGLQVD